MGGRDRLQLDEIISTFAKDLVARGRANSEEEVGKWTEWTSRQSFFVCQVSRLAAQNIPAQLLCAGLLFPSLLHLSGSFALNDEKGSKINLF